VSLIGIAIYSLGCVSGLFAMTAPVGTGNGTMKKAALSRSCCRIFNDGLFSFPSLNRIDDIADFPKPLGHASALDDLRRGSLSWRPYRVFGHIRRELFYPKPRREKAPR
jgi:hypothetical protein